MIDPGKHKVKIKDYGISCTDAGDMRMMVVFETDSSETAVWYGWLTTDKAMRYTLATLKKLGYKSKEINPKLADGPHSNLLDMSIEVVIDVEHHVGDEKKWANVTSVLGLDESQGKSGSLSSQEVARRLSEMTSEEKTASTKPKAKPEKIDIDNAPF
jgi:hypothetical protein